MDPLRRYHSAREFAEEIGRYLSHRPVRATPDGWAYRTRRFLQRHRAACAAGALAVLAVAGGSAASLYEAHRAQQRFAQVRQLANRFVFDFEAEIRNTPGTLKARRMVAATARENLASLVSDSSRDQSLNRELAESYYRLSGVESSAGENDTSIEHLKRSLQIQKELRDDCCGAPPERLRYVKALTDLAYALESSQTPEDSLRFSGEALALARDWSTKSPAEKLAGRALLTALSVAGSAYSYEGKYLQARQVLEEGVSRGNAMLKQAPNDEDLIYDVARANHWLAEAVANTDGPRAAAPAEAESKALMDSLLKRNPENTHWRALRIVIASTTTLRLKRLQGKDPSLQAQVTENAREANTLARENARQNPGDGYALDLAAVMAGQLANQLMITKKMEEVLPLFQEAEGMIDQLLKVSPSDRRYLYMKAGNLLSQGVYFSSGKHWQEDGIRIQRAQETLREIRKRWPGDLNAKDFMVTALLNQTNLENRLGHLDQARETCRQGLALAVELMSDRKDSTNPVTFLGNLSGIMLESYMYPTRLSNWHQEQMSELPTDNPSNITALLARVRLGEAGALDDLLPLVYKELHRLAQFALQRERPGHTLQPTALLHEAFLRLFGGQPTAFADRAHFLGIAARVMRQVLVDYARKRRALKRGHQLMVPLYEGVVATPAHGDLLELDEALDKLGKEDARLVTLIEMRFFAGMTAEETAEARSESVHVIRHDLRYAQARLRRILDRSNPI